MKKLLLPIKKVYWFFKHYYKLYLSHYNRKNMPISCSAISSAETLIGKILVI